MSVLWREFAALRGTFRLSRAVAVLASGVAIVAGGCKDDAVQEPASGGVMVATGGDEQVERPDSGAAGCDEATSASAASAAGVPVTVFVTSDRSKTGNLGGLAGADARCERLAAAAGLEDRRWHAYLSVEHDACNGDGVTHARDRIGQGPWQNVLGAVIATEMDELLARNGDAELFLDEHGEKIPGQWLGSPAPVEHDILTGTGADGMLLPGKTCADWTSDSAALSAQVGHSDGLGPMMNPNPPYASWHASHENGGCNDTAPRGGAGRLYCFGLAL